MIKHFDITVLGKVQAVGFRYHAKQMAEELGINGMVQNMPDGSVYIEAEAEESALQKLLQWCREGPDMANVATLEYKEAEVKNYQTFEIIGLL